MISFVEAMHDPQLLGPWFEPAASWAAWRVFSKALFGLPMTADEAEAFRRHTNRQIIPDQPAKEAWLCFGRRGGSVFFRPGALCLLRRWAATSSTTYADALGTWRRGAGRPSVKGHLPD